MQILKREAIIPVENGPGVIIQLYERKAYDMTLWVVELRFSQEDCEDLPFDLVGPLASIVEAAAAYAGAIAGAKAANRARPACATCN